MTTRFSTGLINDMYGENGVETGAGGLKYCLKNGIIHCYSGAQPASANDAPSGTYLGYITKDGGAWAAGSPTNGLQFDSPAGGSISKAAAQTWKFVGVAAGTIGWARFKGNAADNDLSSTTLPRIDFSVGTTSGDMKIASVSSTVGGTITVDTFTIAGG